MPGLFIKGMSGYQLTIANTKFIIIKEYLNEHMDVDKILSRGGVRGNFFGGFRGGLGLLEGPKTCKRPPKTLKHPKILFFEIQMASAPLSSPPPGDTHG